MNIRIYHSVENGKGFRGVAIRRGSLQGRGATGWRKRWPSPRTNEGIEADGVKSCFLMLLYLAFDVVRDIILYRVEQHVADLNPCRRAVRSPVGTSYCWLCAGSPGWRTQIQTGIDLKSGITQGVSPQLDGFVLLSCGSRNHCR